MVKRHGITDEKITVRFEVLHRFYPFKDGLAISWLTRQPQLPRFPAMALKKPVFQNTAR